MSSAINFSGLTIKQAFLRDVELHQVNLENSELENCVFPEVMGEVWQAVFSADGTILAVGDELGIIIGVGQDATPQKKIISLWSRQDACHPF